MVGLADGLVFFLNAPSGLGATGYIAPAGDFTTLQSPIVGFDTWTHVTWVGAHRLLFYNSASGAAVTGQVNADGTFTTLQTYTSGFSPGWTNIAGGPGGLTIFYNASTRSAATGRVNSDGTFAGLQPSIGGFASWTHVVQVDQLGINQLLLFYDANTGNGSTGTVSGVDGTFADLQDYFGAFALWTNLTGGPALFFYDQNSGNGASGTVNGNGIFANLENFAGLGSWTHATSVYPGGILWLGNDSCNAADLTTATDTSGNILEIVPAAVTGLASDGTYLYFSDCFGTVTKRTADGNTVLASFSVPRTDAEDMAWDSKRARLWRVSFSPPTLHRIDPASGTEDAAYPLPTAANGTNYGGVYGVAYDPLQDHLFVSLSPEDGDFSRGAVGVFDPSSGTYLGTLFQVSGYVVGGLGFDPVTATLWALTADGVNPPQIVNMKLDGTPISSFPAPGSRFADGFEFVRGVP